MDHDNLDLDELKNMIGDAQGSDDFDLDSIIAEVEGGAPAAPQAAPSPAPRAAKPVSAPAAKKPIAEPVEAPQPAEAPAEDARAARQEQARALRAQRKAEKQERAAAKQAARAQAAAEAESEEPEEPEASEEPRVSRAERRAERKAEREREQQEYEDEEEEEIALRDPVQAQRAFLSRTRGLSFRSVLVLILAAAAAYLSLAPDWDLLPLPQMLNFYENNTLAVGLLIGLQIVALLLAVDIFGLGFLNLVSGTPDRATIVSVAVVAALAHGVYIIAVDASGAVSVPYIALSILLLYASMREERNRFAARYRAYKVIASVQEPKAIFSHFDRADDSCRAVKKPLESTESFIREMERPDSIDRFSYIYTPIALAACIIFALLCSFGMGEAGRFFWAFSALLSICAPLGLICAFGASYKNVSRRLLGAGAALSGARQANHLRDTEEVVLTERELFPNGSITLEAIQNMGEISDEKIISYAAAMTAPLGLELGRVLAEVQAQRGGMPLATKNIERIEGGLVGEVGAQRVILGTAALMVKMGMRMRSGQNASTCNTYLVIGNTLVGVLAMRYQPTTHTYRAMRTMRKMHMNAALAVRDFNINPAMVEGQFNMRRGFADLPEPADVDRILRDDYAAGDPPVAIMTQEGAGPFVQVLRCCDKLAGAVRSNIALGAFAGICGLLIVFFLLYKDAVSALSVRNFLLYLLIWYVPSFLITQQTH